MNKNKKIKLIISALLSFIICVFSLGLNLEGYEPEDDAGHGLHTDKGNYHMGEANTSYSYSDEEVKYIEKGTGEEVVKTAIEYKKYIEDGIAMWIDAGKTYSEDENYEIINMEELESGGKGTIKLDYNEEKGISWVDADNYDENDPDKKITEWTLTINLYWYEMKNDDGTYVYNDDWKKENIAHEIGHIYGLNDLREFGYNNYRSIMWWQKNPVKSITENVIYGMELCTEAFTSQELVPVGTEDICQKLVCTGNSGGSYTIKSDPTHSWTDESDTICNDCGYMRPIAIEEVDGLLKVTLDGQSWVLNSSGTGTELQYNTSYTLPCNVPVSWVNVGDGGYNRYCYNGYIYGDQYVSNPLRFANLREMTKVKRDEYSYYKLRYIRERPDQRYQFQWVQTTNNLIGGFYVQLFGNEVNGYYVKIYRVLLDGSGNKYHYAEVWSPSMNIPVYFSP